MGRPRYHNRLQRANCSQKHLRIDFAFVTRLTDYGRTIMLFATTQKQVVTVPELSLKGRPVPGFVY